METLVNDSVEKPVDLAALPANCFNCGAVVRGRFCVDCGQTTDTHVPTLAEVAGDAIASIFNLDSRLWRTVTMLFFKPGLLTREFLAGRRARYVPPLRLYLVLSVLTFLVMTLAPDGDNADDAFDLSGTPRPAAQEDAIEAGPDPDAGLDKGFDCDRIDIPIFDRGGAVESAVREACDEGKADDFDSISDAFLDNIPLLAFMVIPVMAVVFKVFYVFARRNYLAHLVFLCHTHAFTFMLFVVLTALRFVAHAVPMLSTPMTVLWVLMFLFYAPAYYFLAMRRVYEQGVMLTLLKEFLLMIVYLFAVTLVFAVGFIVVMLAT
jgi:hypothetical protein